MLKIILMIPYAFAVAAFLFFAQSVWLLFTGHWGWAIPTSVLSLSFGAIAYMAIRVQQRIDAAKVVDAVIERVKKKA